MEPIDHLIKAYRIGNTVKKLDPEEDCEVICGMLGECATNLINVALKLTGMIEKSERLAHSNWFKGKLYDRSSDLPFQWEKLDSVTEEALKKGLSFLHEIEIRRADNVRGNKTNSSEAKESLEFYEKIKEKLLKIIF